MALPSNIFQAVQRYVSSELAYLLNLNVFISTTNTKFKNFTTEYEGNLGDSITFDLPPRFITANSLVVTNQASVQRVHTITVDQAMNVTTDYTAQQQIFNLDPMDYMKVFGKAAVEQLSQTIEIQVAQNVCLNYPFRFYGDGLTPINSFGQISKMLALYRNFGSAISDTQVYLQDVAVADIVNTGLNQFVMNRNEKMSQSWMIGDYDRAKFYRSNLLPRHQAGTVGDSNLTNSPVVLTVISTNDPTGQNITQITFSGATPNDANAIKANDLMQFVDNVSGQPNLRFNVWIGQAASLNPVQVRVTADAAADSSGHVVVNIATADGIGLVSATSQNQNIQHNIVAGMQVSVLPSHRRGLIVGGRAMYLAMPKLPDERPFDTVAVADPRSGVAMRLYMGSILGQNQHILVHDAIWGSTAVPEYLMAIIFPDQ